MCPRYFLLSSSCDSPHDILGFSSIFPSHLIQGCYRRHSSLRVGPPLFPVVGSGIRELLHFFLGFFRPLFQFAFSTGTQFLQILNFILGLVLIFPFLLFPLRLGLCCDSPLSHFPFVLPVGKFHDVLCLQDMSQIFMPPLLRSLLSGF